MIFPVNRFEEPDPDPQSDSRETRYHDCISKIFDYVRALSISMNISMEECLGLLDVVKGSVQLNIALSKCEQEDEHDNYGI